MNSVVAKCIDQGGKKRIELSFLYDPETVKAVKSIPDRSYLPELKIWTIPDDDFHRGSIKKAIPKSFLKWEKDIPEPALKLIKRQE